MSTNEKHASIDLSHHLSALSTARQVSPLKGLQKYFGHPGMVSLAGGMPDPAYFPFASISGDALLPDSFPQNKPSESTLFGWFWSMFGNGATEKTHRLSVPKHAAKAGDIDLATALQYSPATGIQQLQDFVRDFTARVHRPAYSDWKTLAHAGNTDGISRTLSTFCNPGEMLLVEDWTYPSTLAAAEPMNIQPAAVRTDGEGLSSVDLERVLSEWDETTRGAKRPHVLYTVPIGQNPTGATMGLERKKAVYAVCVKYDVIIIEDDPYYFLQEGTYAPKSTRKTAKTPPHPAKDGDEQTRFLNSLTPSFVRVDYQGRVVRLDSFSKIVAPGSRMGWVTANPLFVERLERHGEATTQAPSGFSQSLIIQLLSRHWGFNDFVRWLQGLQTQYTVRRDFFVDCIFDAFDVRQSADPALVAAFGAGSAVFSAYPKTHVMREKRAAARTLPLFSFVPPSSGMFVWLKFHVQIAGLDVSVEEKIWEDLAENGLLVVPGKWFAGEPASLANAGDAHFRISYSMGTVEELKKGVDILAKVLNKY